MLVGARPKEPAVVQMLPVSPLGKSGCVPAVGFHSEFVFYSLPGVAISSPFWPW